MPNTNRPRGASTSNVKRGTQFPSFWIDESGSRATASQCFVVAGVKTRHPDRLARQVLEIREKHGYFGRELKFSGITAGSAKIYFDLADVLAASDVHIVATVIDSRYNPFKGKAQWRAQATIAAQLVAGNLNRNELATVYLDVISTPQGQSMGATVKRAVNSRLGCTAVTDALTLDSRCCDLLQLADMVASAIGNERRGNGGTAGRDTEKTQVRRRLAAAFGVTTFVDQRTERVNIMTLNGPSKRLQAARKKPGLP